MRGAAHAVDHDGDLGAAEIHGIAQDPGQELIHYLVGWLYLLALDAWLAVDADPDLHLVADVEDGPPLSGGMQLVRAIPIERTLELTFSASS